MAQVSNETEAMVWKRPSFCGKGVTDEEWNILHEVIDSCGLSRHELASTICESLGVGSCERKFEIPGNVTSTSICSKRGDWWSYPVLCQNSDLLK